MLINSPVSLELTPFRLVVTDVSEKLATNKVETMVRQAQLIYCVFITGYMFRPIYMSSSGLLTRESVNVMHVGIPSCFTEIKYVKYIKC